MCRSRNGRRRGSFRQRQLTEGDDLFVERIIEVPYQKLKQGDSSQNLIIRPNDRIYVKEAQVGVVYIDGRPLEEPYLADGTVTNQLTEITVPEDVRQRAERVVWSRTVEFASVRGILSSGRRRLITFPFEVREYRRGALGSETGGS